MHRRAAVWRDLGLDHVHARQQLKIARFAVAPRQVRLGEQSLHAHAAVLAAALAVFAPETIFNRVLFAWIAIGSAFGPMVFVRLAGVRPDDLLHALRHPGRSAMTL